MNLALKEAAIKYNEIQQLKYDSAQLDMKRWDLEKEVADLCFEFQGELDLIDYLDSPATFSYTEERFGNLLIYAYLVMQGEIENDGSYSIGAENK